MAATRSSVLPIAGAIAGLAALIFVSIPVLIASALGANDNRIAGLVAGAVCATSGPIDGLSDAAAQNARTAVAVAEAGGGSRASLITLMTGLTESGFRVLGNPNDASSIGLTTDGTGSNHDSLGIFQQRPSWGTAEQRLDPVTSTTLFINRLLAIKNWDSQDPWLAAQAVQDSAWDGIARPENDFTAAVGGNYKAQLPNATRILEIINRDSASLGCDGTGGSGVGVPPSGLLDAHGLPVSFVIPNDGTVEGRLSVVAALSVLGRPYVFGAVGPNAFDCSGLTQWAWARAGVNLPHYTVDQWHSGVPTDEAHLVPGDLVLTPGADGTLSNPQHVGMFIGQALVVEAPQTGDVVKVVTYTSFVSAGVSGLRHIG